MKTVSQARPNPVVNLVDHQAMGSAVLSRTQTRPTRDRAERPPTPDTEPFVPDSHNALRAAALKGQVDMRALARGSYPGTPLPSGVTPGLRTVGHWNAKRPQSWGLDWHRDEGIAITFLERGSLAFATRGHDWPLQPGQFTVTRPWQEHRLGAPHIGASHVYWLILDVNATRPHDLWNWPSWVGLSQADLHRLALLLRANENPVWNGGTALRSAFKSLVAAADEPHTPTLESELLVHTSRLLLAMLHDLEEPSNSQVRPGTSTRTEGAVQRFLENLDWHVDRTWTLDDMAEACGIARSQFSSRCRQLTNMSPLEYLTHRRIELAAEELRSAPDLSIADVAYRFGFSSSQYFATTFRRRKGCSPREYRAAVTAGTV
ncbi:helix-turn-helix transcriptional regulator [Streptomyces sp. NPDC004752]